MVVVSSSSSHLENEMMAFAIMQSENGKGLILIRQNTLYRLNVGIPCLLACSWKLSPKNPSSESEEDLNFKLKTKKKKSIVMGSLLKCPLCCEEEFTCPSSLKCHLLSLADKLVCPECDERFENLIELAEHVGERCGTRFAPVEENADEKLGEEQKPNVQTIDVSSRIEDNETEYFCQMCCMQFTSVGEHVEQYHQGEDVILETDETIECQPDIPKEDEAAGSGAEEDSLVFTLAENENTIEEKSCIDKDGRAYTRKVVKIDQFWLDNTKNTSPIIEKYIYEKGRLRKLTEEEEKTMKGTNSIILVYQCPKCYLQFPRADDYTKHLCNPLQIKQKYKCTHCTMVYDSLDELNTHMSSHLQKNEDGMVKRVIVMGPHTCTICNTMFPSYRSFSLHQKMHEPVQGHSPQPPVNYSIQGSKDGNGIVRGMFICTICNNTYDKEYEAVHMKSHIEVEEFDCSICDKKVYTKENLKMHVKAHMKSEKFSCIYCKKTFTEYDAVKEHVDNKCHMRQYECQFCGRRFGKPHQKVSHERLHTGEKPHVCNVCGKSFRVSYCLTLHLRTHCGTRPYECKYCRKRFKSHSVFNHHLRTHSEIGSYRCSFCPKSFKTRVRLASHTNVHMKTFDCTDCNRPFSNLYALRAHMAVHKKHNNLKFDCWLCGASYARVFALREHVKEQHAVDTSVINDAVLVEIESMETLAKDVQQVREENST